MLLVELLGCVLLLVLVLVLADELAIGMRGNLG
jgi:hypothetical protein